jgi:hypothetical protein
MYRGILTILLIAWLARFAWRHLGHAIAATIALLVLHGLVAP